MKTVFDSAQCAHVWAQQRQPSGRNARGSLFFDGPTSYSYGSHFPLATFTGRTDPATGRQLVLFNSTSYSSSTAKHQRHVRHALTGLPVRVVSAGASATASGREVLAVIVAEYGALLEQAARSKKYTAWLLGQAHAKKADGELIATAYDLPAPAWPTFDRDAIKARLAAQAKAAREIKAKRAKEQAAKQAEQLAIFRRHECRQVPYSNGTVYLRVSRDGATVETSRGAAVPASCAAEVWRLVTVCRKSAHGMDFTTLGNRPVRLGQFELTSISPEGDLRAGCHYIAFSEVQRVCRALGVAP